MIFYVAPEKALIYIKPDDIITFIPDCTWFITSFNRKSELQTWGFKGCGQTLASCIMGYVGYRH